MNAGQPCLVSPSHILCTIWNPGDDYDGSPLLTLAQPVYHTLHSHGKSTA